MKLGEIRVSIFRDQKGIPDTLEVLSNVDSSQENFVDRSAVAALRATTINFQISMLSASHLSHFRHFENDSSEN